MMHLVVLVSSDWLRVSDVYPADELLTLASDTDCSSLVKMLVAAIAGSNHAPEAQTSIVTEVRQ
jgi:hypothetical protein